MVELQPVHVQFCTMLSKVGSTCTLVLKQLKMCLPKPQYSLTLNKVIVFISDITFKYTPYNFISKFISFFCNDHIYNSTKNTEMLNQFLKTALR